MRLRLVVRIYALAENPRPRESEKRSGVGERYRIRQGAFRIVYAIDEVGRVVEVVKIGHRREVYR